MRNNLFLGVAAIALIAPAAAMAQETTSTIRGTVNANNTPVAGATVVAINTSNGARSQTTTDASGGFTFSGLQPGGPYTVEVTSAQGNTTVTDIQTIVQQAYELPIELADAGSSSDIVVTAASIRGAGTTSDGPQSVFTQADIAKVASVNRDVRDILRRDPLATLDPTNTRAVSVAGVNPRFNRFTINGVQVGDNFGLNSDANPTGRGPIPFDALAQVSLSIAPYDIRQGNFQGAAIDTIMLAGTNDFHGTGFYSQSTDGLQGDRIGSTVFNKAKYKSETYGATLRGPLIADKLFFMVSAERNTDPRPLAVSTISQIPGLSQAQITQVQNIAQQVYGYDTGNFLGINAQKDEKIVGKIDWNITTGQRLSLSYINAYESATVAQNTSSNAATPSIGLESNYYQRSVLLRAGIVQLNSDWTDQLSTEIRGYYKSNRVGQDPLRGRGFAQFGVCLSPTSTIASTGDTAQACATGVPRVFFGPDLSRQSNELFFDTWGGSILTRYTAEDHDIKLLAEVNANRTYNFFLQRSAGVYYFDSIADFQNRNASQFDYANAVSLNPRDAASDFRYQQYTFGLQDDWAITDTLTLTYGARYDLFAMRSPIPANDAFFARNGFYNTKTYKGLDNFQPRISFNWKANSDLRIRGGVGIFGGGSPDIYLSNSYSNTGVLSNRISTVTRTAPTTGGATTACAAPYNTAALAGLCTAALNGVTGTSIPGSVDQYLSTNTGALRTATVNALAPNFRLPSVTKATLSADYNLFGFNVGADYIFSMVNQGVDFTDLRSVQIGVLPDGRPRYNFRPTPGVTQTGDTNSDILLFNNGKGRSHIGTVRFNKTTDFGISFGGSYSLQDVKDVSSASSSVAASNYGNNPMSDPNRSQYGISNNQITWAFKYNLGFDHAFFGDNRTIIQLFGETRAGRRYSYTMQNSVARSPVFGTLTNVSSDSPDQRFLIYVPTGASDPLVSYDNAQTQADLDALINNTKLKDYRGKIAPKNIARSRAFTRIDLHLEQEIPTFLGGSKLSVFADIENLPNLLNSNWGGLRQLGFPNYAPLVQVSCLSVATPTGTGVANIGATAAQNPTGLPTVVNTLPTQTCAQYRYSSFRAPNDSVPSTVNSLYLIRVGARFSF